MRINWMDKLIHDHNHEKNAIIDLYIIAIQRKNYRVEIRMASKILNFEILYI